ncbi:hypothetical protein TGME49_313235 [Toxoplasma gondii ME49]|uniref:Transmembrane protein n=7 Tax=Toxoplasma gondii TaxID=5811 RepID=A0A125YPF2_TOXGV|nr:hypothetical protein TGME49_313235 [Toxoplasma gondii ME49]EPR60959.1 hypothetical protein TGGT1_313235 [Toxoplasma gondii GT1]ESS35086.1 putative transmembrane protein [Toxoplasma gondii VEG]KAF4639465.1 hypothetical protein TGRH88_052370 [Toxoplasma gondii]KFG66094.1 putative transmembrane protein [Toxoplasma gondii RUB]KYF48326.1 hypothetical protein TGARI_313235 [Toxoplasma gondii ARI]PIM00555.1 putative transmembrane protein [Toxoplasma gondii COUG]|eukprot:XP_018635440.1 hypothetical protein TGME49_313235 [Toxoplasma gondii ME49]
MSTNASASPVEASVSSLPTGRPTVCEAACNRGSLTGENVGSDNQNHRHILSVLVDVLKGHGEDKILASRARAIVVVGVVSFLLATACASMSLVTAYRKELYAYGALEFLLALLVLFFSCQAGIYKGTTHCLLFAASSLCMAFLQIVLISFGVFTVITLEEELDRVDDTSADPAELLMDIALRILQCFLSAVTLLSYSVSTCIGFRLREYLLQPPIIVVARQEDAQSIPHQSVRLEPPF